MTWQPSDTAPKDGRQILTHDGDDISVCRWDGRKWLGMCDGFSAIQSQGDTWTDYHEPFVKFWMPLPDPPAILDEGVE